MRKAIAFLLSFTIVICCFVMLGIFVAEKVNLPSTEHHDFQAIFTEEDGATVLSWKPTLYPCMYQVDTYYKTTGLVPGEPEYYLAASERTVQPFWQVPSTAIPTYYRITAIGPFGRSCSHEQLLENPHYPTPIRPVAVSKYPQEKPASLQPYLIWHGVPDGVVYELELLSGPPDAEYTTQLSTVNSIYATQQVFTNGLQIDLTPYQNYPVIYWRVRAMNLRKEPLGVFSQAEPLYLDSAQPVPHKPLLNHHDRMPDFTQPIYPVFTWIPMLGAVRYEVELMTEPPAHENDTNPTPGRAWSQIVDSSFSCYDEYARPYAGRYYWRVRGLDAQGNPVGTWSDTDSFVVEARPNRPLLAAFGDSITHGGGAVSFSPASLEYSYTTYIDIPCINLGHSGDTSTTTLERFEQDVLPINPQNLLIMTGSNSLRSSYISADTVIEDLRQIAEKCRANDIRPILMTLPPINPDNILFAFGTYTDPDWHAKMQAINDFIRQQEYYIDLEPYFYDPTHTVLDPQWANDGLHADVRGKMLMGEIINMHKHLFRQ